MVKGFLRGLFSKAPTEDKRRQAAKARFAAPAAADVATPPANAPAPDERQARIDRMKALIREWQLHWHDQFDADQTLIAAGEFERPDPIPDDMDRDYRLIFGISRAEKATRDACFAPLPKGAEMAARFDAYLTSNPVPMPEADAMACIDALADMVRGADTHEEVNFANRRVVDRDTPEGLAELRKVDNLTYIFEAKALDPYSSNDLAATTALTFLSEPLYMSCGNYYDLRDWVAAVMFDPRWDALQAHLFRLWDGGWQVFFDDDGIVLAKRHVGPKAG